MEFGGVLGWKKFWVGRSSGLEEVPGWRRCRVGGGAGFEEVPGLKRFQEEVSGGGGCVQG